MKSAFTAMFRSLLRKAGFEILHRSDDPLLRSLLRVRELLRVSTRLPAWKADHALAQLALQGHLRNVVRGLAIDLVIDVGANEGQFALGLRELGYRGPILSFEPQAARCAKLRALAANDAHWQIHALALGEATAELTLNTYRDHTLSSLHEVNATGQQRFPDLFELDHVERVPVRRLDEFLADIPVAGSARKILLKTDTQGHDLAVLRGAPSTLSRTSVVLSEAAIQPIYRGVPGYLEIIQFLEGAGFALSGIYPLAHSDRDFSLIEVDCCFVRGKSGESSTATAPR